MNAASYDIKDMLELESVLGLVYGQNLFIGREPAEPANCVTIYDTPAFPPATSLNRQSYYHASVQIRVRHIGYLEGWAQIESIKDTLHARAQATWNGTLYTAILAASGCSLLEWDANGNAVFIVNFNIQRR